MNLTEYLFIFIFYYYDYYRGDQEQFASARRRWGKLFILSTGVYAVLYRSSPLAVRSPFFKPEQEPYLQRLPEIDARL